MTTPNPDVRGLIEQWNQVKAEWPWNSGADMFDAGNALAAALEAREGTPDDFGPPITDANLEAEIAVWRGAGCERNCPVESVTQPSGNKPSNPPTLSGGSPEAAGGEDEALLEMWTRYRLDSPHLRTDAGDAIAARLRELCADLAAERDEVELKTIAMRGMSATMDRLAAERDAALASKEATEAQLAKVEVKLAQANEILAVHGREVI
jgi:hypothetical protein